MYMLYWICPECGHECSPAIRECPTCAMATESAPAASAPVQKQPDQTPPESGISQEIINLAQSFDESRPVITQAVAPQVEPVSSVNGHTDHAPQSTVVVVEEPVETAAAPSSGQEAAETVIESLVRPLVESAK
jgi:hypothetical protein